MSRTGESRVLLHDLFAGLLSEKSSRKKKSEASQSGVEATDNETTSSVVEKPVSTNGTESEKDPEDHLKFEYSVIGWLESVGVIAEHIGGSASYDIYIKGYRAGFSGAIKSGEYEVKSFKDENTLAMLGQEKARPVLSSDFIKGLVRLGSHFSNSSDEILSEIDSINSKDRTKLRSQVYWFTSPAGGGAQLPRYESYLGLELSSPVYNEIFKNNLVNKSFEQRIDSLIDGIYNAILDHDTKGATTDDAQTRAPSPSDVVSVYYKGQSGKEHLLGTTTRRKLRLNIRPALEDPSKVPGSEAESLAETSSGNFKNLIMLYSLLEDLKSSCKGTNMDDIKKKALESVKGVFGVEKNGEDSVTIYLFDSSALKVESVTRGGRLVLAVVDGKKIDGSTAKLLDNLPKSQELSVAPASTSVNRLFGTDPPDRKIGELPPVVLNDKVIRNEDGKVMITWKDFRESFLKAWKDGMKGAKVWSDALRVFGVEHSLKKRPSKTEAVKACWNALNGNEYEITDKGEEEPGAAKTQESVSEARGRNRTSRSEVSMGGVPGVMTPVGTDASGGKGGPGRRRGVRRRQSILDKNAATQGKNWGGAKRVNEASNTTRSVGTYGYVYYDGNDVDGDGDFELTDSAGGFEYPIYRGGGGNLEKNAKEIGRHFCSAEVIEGTYELLQDLLKGKDLTPAQTRRFKRNAHES